MNKDFSFSSHLMNNNNLIFLYASFMRFSICFGIYVYLSNALSLAFCVSLAISSSKVFLLVISSLLSEILLSAYFIITTNGLIPYLLFIDLCTKVI
jgi:hypothetical protein